MQLQGPAVRFVDSRAHSKALSIPTSSSNLPAVWGGVGLGQLLAGITTSLGARLAAACSERTRARLGETRSVVSFVPEGGF